MTFFVKTRLAEMNCGLLVYLALILTELVYFNKKTNCDYKNVYILIYAKHIWRPTYEFTSWKLRQDVNIAQGSAIFDLGQLRLP